MKTIRSDQFDHFRCIAGACPKSCCTGGWCIEIDEDSLDRYSEGTGIEALDNRLLAGIDWEEEYYLVKQNGDCAMLDPDGLCSIQRAVGEDWLCGTCHTYPRHVEEFENVREWSLSLSCPEAARMLLSRTDPIHFIYEETPELDDPEDYEDVDSALYDILFQARTQIFAVIQDRSLRFRDKAKLLSFYAQTLDQAVSAGSKSLIPLNRDTLSEPGCDPLDSALFSVMLRLDLSENDWQPLVRKTLERWDDSLTLSNEQEIMAEQLLVFWFYTYFCGAVYDGLIFSAAMLSICSVWWIFMIHAAHPGSDLIEISYLYARLIEHSDANLDALEAFFDSHKNG